MFVGVWLRLMVVFQLLFLMFCCLCCALILCRLCCRCCLDFVVMYLSLHSFDGVQLCLMILFVFVVFLVLVFVGV